MADVTIKGRTYPGITDIKIGNNVFKSTAETITYPGLVNVNTYTHSADWSTGKTLLDFIREYFGYPSSTGEFFAIISNNTAASDLDTVAFMKEGSAISAAVMKNGNSNAYTATTEAGLTQILAGISAGASVVVYTFSAEG